MKSQGVLVKDEQYPLPWERFRGGPYIVEAQLRRGLKGWTMRFSHGKVYNQPFKPGCFTRQVNRDAPTVSSFHVLRANPRWRGY